MAAYWLSVATPIVDMLVKCPLADTRSSAHTQCRGGTPDSQHGVGGGPVAHRRPCYIAVMLNTPPPTELGTHRDELPYFAGRKAELSALGQRLRRLCSTGDPRGGMSLIMGVPGVGKTQLGLTFAKDAVANKSPPRVRHLALNTSLLENDIDLFMAIAQTLGAEKIGREVADLDSKNTRREFGVGWLKAGRTREHARHTGRLFALLLASSHTRMWRDVALLLTIDELQTVRPNGLAALRVLHEGDHGCPMLVVGIGLQHTPAVLAGSSATPGISRLAQVIRLRPLQYDDAVDAIECNLLALGHTVPKTCLQALAKASQGFPQHIHGYLAAALQAIDEHGGLNEGPSLQSALQAGQQARIDYYDSRLRLLQGIKPMQALAATMNQRDTSALAIEDAALELDTAGFNGQEALDKAIVHGVLAEDPPGSISFGIPSFHGYMVELGR